MIKKTVGMPSKRRLSLGILVALLPVLILAGGVPGAVRAGLPTQGATPNQVTATSIVVMRIYFKDAAERDRLATELGVEEVGTSGGFLTLWSDMSRYNSLRAQGLKVEIDADATRRANLLPDSNGASPDTFYGGYRTVEEMQAFLDTKVAQNPTLAEKLDIGDSWCKANPGQCTQPNAWNGFDLNVLRITNQAIPGPKPVFWFDAGIHSREIATPEVAMRFIDYLLNGYGVDADATWLVDWQDIYVMPMLNPDGHHMNESNGQGQPTMHRKNADRNDGCSTYDQFGTDINRNFNFQWGCCGGSSGNACSETYRCPAAESEEETQAVAAKVRQLIPDQRGPNESDLAPLTTTGTLINMHAFAAQNLYPWGYTSAFAPNRTDLRNIGRHMSSPQAQPPGNGYEYCQNTECLYIVDGDEKNWAYGELGIPAYSLELRSSNTFFPPYTSVENEWQTNRGALLYHSKIARAPYLLTRGPDTNSAATTPMTVTQGTPSLVSATINYNWSGALNNQPNAYLQNVATAEYYIDTPPWAGGTPVAMQPTDGSFNSPTEGAQATIDTTSLPVGRHIVFVRGRGVNSYEGYESWGPVSATWLTVTAGGGSTPTVAATSTTVPPTATNTVLVPTSTAVPPTSTPLAPTATSIAPTGTSIAPSATSTAVLPTSTSSLPTLTVSQPSATSTSVQATSTVAPPTQISASATPTVEACLIKFTDVPSDHTFYSNVRCLACRGIIGGYSDGTFRPNNDITRGQIAKMVSGAAGFNEPAAGQSFEDVPPSQTFYQWIERLATRGDMGGYACGGPLEPCIAPGNRPYFRPNANATRGQLAKIVAGAADITTTPTGQFYTDVASSNTFYVWIMQLTEQGVMGGYTCGGPGEPCDSENRPYFRPFNPVTRGQASKIVANTFFPGCVTP